MTVLFTEAFTLTNGNLTGRNGWLNNAGVGGQQIVVNTNTAGISSATDDILCRQTGTSSAAAHIYVQATHNASFNTGGVGVGMAVACCVDSGGAVTYIRLVTNLAGWELARFNAGAFTSLASGSSTTFANLDKFRLEYNKSTGAWALYKFTGASPGTAFATGTDPSPLSGTQFGVGYSSVGNSISGIDDFEFGDFAGGGTTISPAEAPVVVTGQTPSIQRILSPASAAVVVTGQTPSLGAPTILSPGSAPIVVTGQTPSIQRVLSPAEAPVIITGQTPSLQRTLAPTEAAVVVTGQTPTLQRTLGPAEAAVVVTGQTPTLQRILSPTNAGVVVTGNTPSFGSNTVLSPAEAPVVITGQTPSIQRILSPGSAAVVITGQTPFLGAPTIISPAEAPIVVTGQTPSIQRILSPAEAGVVVTGQAPTLQKILSPTSGAVVITGQTPFITNGTGSPGNAFPVGQFCTAYGGTATALAYFQGRANPRRGVAHPEGHAAEAHTHDPLATGGARVFAYGSSATAIPGEVEAVLGVRTARVRAFGSAAHAAGGQVRTLGGSIVHAMGSRACAKGGMVSSKGAASAFVIAPRPAQGYAGVATVKAIRNPTDEELIQIIRTMRNAARTQKPLDKR